MTAMLTLLWVGAISQNQELAAPPITNPLPVLKGQIGKGRARVSAPPSGYAPLNPTLLPGVSFALKSVESSEPVTVSSPASQGPNSAFDSALDQLFGRGSATESAAKRESTAENEVRVTGQDIALPLSQGQEEIL